MMTMRRISLSVLLLLITVGLWGVAVRYAFHNLPEGNLTNTLGLPAFPFRTDRWDDVR